MAALGVLWGSAYVAIREGLVGGASPFVYAGTRYALVALLLALVALVRREELPSRRSAVLSAAIGGTFIIGLYGMLLYWGEQFTTAGYAAVLAGTAPLTTLVFAHSLLPSERLRPLAVTGVVIGFLGVVIIVLPSLAGGVGTSWQGPLAVMSAFIVFPLGSVLFRRWSHEREGLWQLSIQFGVGAAILGLAVLVAPVPEQLPFTLAVWGPLLVLVVFASLVGYVVYFTLHHRIGPGRANLVAYIIPLVGIGLGSGLYGEAVTVWEVGGFLLVVAGLSLVFATGNRTAPSSASIGADAPMPPTNLPEGATSNNPEARESRR